MPQPTPEATAFVQRTAAATDHASFGNALGPALEHEAVLRKAYAGDRSALPQSPYAGLVDLYDDGCNHLTRTLAREIKSDEDRDARYVMPVTDGQRRNSGSLAMQDSLEDFRKVFNIFSEGTLGQLGSGPWSNVIVAGGSVLAALLPLSDKVEEQGSKRAIRKYFHEEANWASSDVDLFLWGLTPDEAEKRCIQIYEAVRDSVPWDVTCIRTKHAITLASQYPYRNVQIVLRLYSSPAEVLAGFDVDCACLAFDGSRIWASPRAIGALVRQCNTIDVTRRSPSYEVRLTKYARRGFEISVPDLRRENIDPTIFERSLARIAGLARLLVLEKISSSDERMAFLEKRRNLRGIPVKSSVYTRRTRTYKGDIKADSSGLEISSYESAVFHLPYGPKFDAARIEKIVYGNDLGLNSPFNPKNKKRPDLHRHPAFFGTMTECIEDCCEFCPEPEDDDAKAIQDEESEVYIRGRIRFIEDDPGRQSVGSFKPLDAESWSSLSYLSLLNKLFLAIAAKDVAATQACLVENLDLNSRDHVGRTALHVAILSYAPIDIVNALVEAGARVTARLADGRTPLMLAAEVGSVEVAQLLLDRSKKNAEEEAAKQKAKEIEEQEKAAAKAAEETSIAKSGSDDGSGEHDSEKSWNEVDDNASSEAVEVKKEDAIPSGEADPVLDEELLPDIIDLSAVDWHFHFNALMHSIAAGHLAVFELLLAAGISATEAVKVESTREALYPLAITLLTKDKMTAAVMARKLVNAGAVSSAGDNDNVPIFHRAVATGNIEIVHALLRFDPKAKSVLDIPIQAHPLVTAIATNSPAMVVLLLAYGAKTVLTQEDYDNAQAAQKRNNNYYSGNDDDRWRSSILMPVEASLSSRNELFKLLIALGAEVSLGLQNAYYSRWNEENRANLIDFVREGVRRLELPIKEAETKIVAAYAAPKKGTFKAWYFDIILGLRTEPEVEVTSKTLEEREETERKKALLLEYLKDAAKFLENHDAKTWNEANPDSKRPDPKQDYSNTNTRNDYAAPDSFNYKLYDRNAVAEYQVARYDELFEAIWTGDEAKVLQLCLPTHAAKDEKRPLEIAVGLNLKPNAWWMGSAVNPFTVACLAKRWHMARLVLTIAAAQHHKKEDEDNGSGADWDSGSDGDGDSGDDSDYAPPAPRPIDLEDIAHRVSKVYSSTPPSTLVTASWEERGQDGKLHDYTVLAKAVADKDLETFSQVLSMLPDDEASERHASGLLGRILGVDSSEMLDEYIRKTGEGIYVDESHESVKKSDPDELEAERTKGKRQYFGLTVHGVKRKDLASKNDPDAPGHSTANQQPLLWAAAQSGAKKIIAWLHARSGPIAAFNFFITAKKSSERAKLLRRLDLSADLPTLLGFGVNNFRESPLLAVINSHKPEGELVETLKLLLHLFPEQASHLDLAEERNWFTPLLLSCQHGCSSELFAFLRVKGVNLEAVDVRGYNILHMACRSGHKKLLDAILQLPADTIRALAIRASNQRQDTPLMLSVKNGNYSFVQRLLNVSPQSQSIPDVHGFLPLHVAVQAGRFEIARLLIDAGSDTSLENSVGETAIEVLRREDLKSRKQSLNRSAPTSSASYSNSASLNPVPFVESAEQINESRAILAKLQKEDVVSPATDITTNIQKYLDDAEQRPAQVLPKKGNDDADDKLGAVDFAATFKLLATSGKFTRSLASLSLIQESVANSLDGAKKEVRNNQYHNRRNWDAGEDKEKGRGYQLLTSDYTEDT